MNSRTEDKSVKEPKPRASDAAASAPGEHYRRTDGGFVLVKTLKGGTQIENPLSNFDAEIIAELVRIDPQGGRRIDGFVVETRFGEWVKQGKVSATDNVTPVHLPKKPFDERLLEFALSIHPMASVLPGKEKHVISAMKTLSAPQTVLKESGADKKTNNNKKPINSRKA